jgi:hypothetical protein
MNVDDIHVGYYVRQVYEGCRYLTVGQGPLVKAMALAHLSPCFAVFANLKAPYEEQPSTLSKVVRDARTGELLETFARSVDINYIVGWLLLGGDRYIRSCVEAIGERNLIPQGEGRSLWFEFDRVTGALVSAGYPAGTRMEKAWTEPWPDELVIVHFCGGHQSLGMLTDGVGVAGLNDLSGVWTGNPSHWPPR